MAERSINAALVEEARALDARGNFADLGVPDYRRMIRRLADALEALEREAGEGWVLVPREPTEAMIEASFGVPGTSIFGNVSRGVYRAMLAGAPLHPPPSKGESR